MIQPSNPIQNRWAFLVGINTFVDPRFKRLNFCVNDVLALKELLEGLGYTVVVLHDNSSEERHQPTRDNVEAELQQLCQVIGKDDLLFVHFACHGKLVEGQPILVMKDSREQLLRQPEKRLSVDQVKQVMRESGARRLFLSLDACHTGVEMGRGDDDVEFVRNVYELAEGFVVMAGSTAQQKALELNTVKHGVYTYYLLKALSGEAARGKQFVSVDDVEKYVVDQCKRWGAKTGLIQEPTIEKAGMGDMVLVDWRDRNPPTQFAVASDAQIENLSVTQRSGFQQLSDFERRRRETQRSTLQSEWDLRTEKLAQLRQAYAIEAGAAMKFQLEKQIQAEEEAIKGLENSLFDFIQDELARTSGFSTVRPNAMSPEKLEKQELEKEYANLTRKYELLGEQIAGELNEDNKETLRARRETLHRRMSEVYSRLQGR